MITYLIEALYTRTENILLQHGEFKVVGDTIIIHPSNADVYYKITFWGNEIEKIQQVNYIQDTTIDIKNLNISPANIFVTLPYISWEAIFGNADISAVVTPDIFCFKSISIFG